MRRISFLPILIIILIIISLISNLHRIITWYRILIAAIISSRNLRSSYLRFNLLSNISVWVICRLFLLPTYVYHDSRHLPNWSKKSNFFRSTFECRCDPGSAVVKCALFDEGCSLFDASIRKCPLLANRTIPLLYCWTLSMNKTTTMCLHNTCTPFWNT